MIRTKLRNIYFILPILFSAVFAGGFAQAGTLYSGSDNFHIQFDIPDAELAASLNLPEDIGHRAEWSNEYVRNLSSVAEKFRTNIAEEWLGKSLPIWDSKVPVFAALDERASGQTTFTFKGRRVHVWDEMIVAGSPQALKEDSLPHEISHALFASYFGRPIPRWADEGAAMSSESIQSQNRFVVVMLDQILNALAEEKALSRLLQIKQYPKSRTENLSMYGQSALLVRYLVSLKGKARFMEFVGDLVQSEKDIETLRLFYGFSDETDVQIHLINWISEQNFSDSRPL